MERHDLQGDERERIVPEDRATTIVVESAEPPRERLELDPVGAVFAALIATLAMTLLLYVLPPVPGLPPFDLAAALGTLIVPRLGPSAWALGMAWHFANGVVFTLVHAALLLAAGRQSTLRSGLAFGAGLWLIGAMLLLPPSCASIRSSRRASCRAPGSSCSTWGGAGSPPRCTSRRTSCSAASSARCTSTGSSS